MRELHGNRWERVAFIHGGCLRRAPCVPMARHDHFCAVSGNDQRPPQTCQKRKRKPNGPCGRGCNAPCAASVPAQWRLTGGGTQVPLLAMWTHIGAWNLYVRGHTAVLPKIPHSNSCKRVLNRPLRPRRGRFGTLLQQLECGIFGRTAVRAGFFSEAMWIVFPGQRGRIALKAQKRLDVMKNAPPYLAYSLHRKCASHGHVELP